MLKAWKALAPLLSLLVVEMMMKVLSNGVATALCKVLQGQGSARRERGESFKTELLPMCLEILLSLFEIDESTTAKYAEKTCDIC